MKIKRLILVSMALASSVFVIGTGVYHQSINNERVKVEVLEGDFKNLGDDKLTFSNGNSMLTENVIEVSSNGIERSTKKYRDTNYMILNSMYNSTMQVVSDEFMKEYKEFYETLDSFKNQPMYIDYIYNFGGENPYMAYTVEDGNDLEYASMMFVHYNENNIFEEKNIQLKKSDFNRNLPTNNMIIKPLAVYKRDANNVDLIVKTSNDGALEVYDFVSVNLETGGYKSQNIIISRLNIAFIGKDFLYISGYTGDDSVIRKIDLKDFDNIEDIYSENELRDEYSQEGIIFEYTDVLVNTIENRLELFDFPADKETQRVNGKLDIKIIDGDTSKVKDYNDIAISENEHIQFINQFIMDDKLVISYTNKPLSYDKYVNGYSDSSIDSDSFIKVIDLNTKETLLKLKVNIGDKPSSRVIE